MGKIERSGFLPIIPALWASLLDICITISGQPAGYWKGNLNIANERNPIGSFFMTNHITGIFIISGIWIVLILILGYYLPNRISRIFLLFVLIAHSWGASSWIPKEYFFAGSLLLFLFNAILYVLMDELSSKERLIKGTAINH
ncbi:MAG: hypothetical protein HC905_12575 [Bacteroidales bacterium]|nr:hypothetical protein [Bacteroidales bacterium]